MSSIKKHTHVQPTQTNRVSKRNLRLKTLGIAISLCLISNFAPRQSNAAIIMMPDYGLGLGVTTVGVVVGIFTHANRNSINYHGEKNLKAAAWTLGIVGLVLDDEDVNAEANIHSVLKDLAHIRDEKTRSKILKDFQFFSKLADHPSVDSSSVHIPMPKVLENFLQGHLNPSIESLETSECEYLHSAQKILSQLATKALKSTMEEGEERDQAKYEVSLETTKYLLEKWPTGFETDLTPSEIQERILSGTCSS